MESGSFVLGYVVTIITISKELKKPTCLVLKNINKKLKD